MNLTLKVLCQSVRFHARSHLGSLFGVVAATAVLVGALAVGDSVRQSLRDLHLSRLGRVDFALSSQDRFFRAQLADDLSLSATNTAAALLLRGTAANSEGTARANQVQILGVNQRFWSLAQNPPSWANTNTECVALNEALAGQLQVKVGDTVLIRVQKPSALPAETPLAVQEGTSLAARWPVGAIVSDSEFGRFGLQANQVSPCSVFIPLSQLQTKLGLQSKANLLLVASPAATTTNLSADLRQHFQMADAGLEVRPVRSPGFSRPNAPKTKANGILNTPENTNASPAKAGTLQLQTRLALTLTLSPREREPDIAVSGESLNGELHPTLDQLLPLPGGEGRGEGKRNSQLHSYGGTPNQPPGGLELVSDRIFLDAPIVLAALNAAPDARTISTYFVNELKVGDRAAPYSTVTAMGFPVVPSEMRDDEILINQWLADDLQAKPGETLSLKYFVMGQTRRLEEKQDQFRIRAIIPLEGPAADPTLMPEFPGLAKAEKTENWDAGFPLDMGKIRPKDEQYWKEHRGTPKAFVTVKAGQRLWGNRFGDFTAIRFNSSIDRSSLIKNLKLDPAALGFAFTPVRQQAIAAGAQAQDFGELFLSFSFFLIVAALILLALLFQFGLEKRTAEIGLYLALGLRPRQVRGLFLLEGVIIAVLGGLLGVVGGITYAKGILFGLTTLWRSAVGVTALQFHVTLQTLAIGAAASILISTGVIWLTLRNQAKRPARELLEQGADLEAALSKRRWAGWLAVASAGGALALIGSALVRRDTTNVEAFFGGSALLLASGLFAAAAWLRRLAGAAVSRQLSLTQLVLRGCARRRTRSLATIALLASGAFLIVAVEANKLDATQNSAARSSGTGGFALIGQTALPVVQDLNSKAGRDFFGLGEMPGVNVVPLRVRDGDDASCLNLNRAQVPRLLGVNPAQLQTRNAFTFTATVSPALQPWQLLTNSQPGGPIPAIADEASILWALGKKVGDTLDYPDEHGNPFKIRLVGAVANSILQGNLIIDEAQFVKHFPNETGYRMFLIDTPEPTKTAAALTRALQDSGMELTPASRRLDSFNAVQNTYLNTFQILGGLGLLLGSAGLGAVVLRNVLERRSELATLLALGFKPRTLRWLVLSEHAVLLCLGLILGIGAALIAVLPSLLSPSAQISWTSLALTLGLVFLNGLLCAWAAARLALRGELLGALRNE